MKKICTKCKEVKELSDFNKNKITNDGYNNICRKCSNERSRRYYQENKEHHKKVIMERNQRMILENRKKLFEYYKNNPCVDCGETDPLVLELDHKDDVDKVNNVSDMIRGYSWLTIEKEIEKCNVRCANCHRRKTGISQGWYKDLI